MEKQPTNPKKPRWSFYASWIMLTALCVPAAFIVSLVILKMVTGIVGSFIYVNGVRHITEDYLAMYTLVPLMGLFIGLVQYWLLRQYLPGMGGWVPLTIGGWLLGMLLVALPGWLHWMEAPLSDLALIFLLMGFSIGLVQWLLLRKRLPQAGWWIAANLAGWGLLALVLSPWGNSIDQYGLIVLGFLPACATAVALALLMGQVPAVEARA